VCELSEALTAKEVLRQEKSHFQRILENIGDVIFEVDHQGVVLYLSPMGEEIIIEARILTARLNGESLTRRCCHFQSTILSP
jgi:PAS domain-containing protein